MTNKKIKFANFLVTISFVVFILLFLSSLVFLSRMVLSGDSELGTYISSTQNLLREADRVQQEVENVNISRNEIYIKFPESIFVEDLSTLSTNQGKSFITFKINRTTFQDNGNIYFKPLDIEEIEIGDKVMLNSGKNARALKGDDEEYDFTFYINDDKSFIEGNFSQIKGVMLYED